MSAFVQVIGGVHGSVQPADKAAGPVVAVSTGPIVEKDDGSRKNDVKTLATARAGTGCPGIGADFLHQNRSRSPSPAEGKNAGSAVHGVAIELMPVVPGSMESKKKAEHVRKRRTCGEWCEKYFCAGQIKEKSGGLQHKKLPAPAGSSWFYANFVWERPPIVGTLLPSVFVFSAWITFMTQTDSFGLYANPIGASGTPGWKLFVMMIFGSFVAGATSEGGGSIAYPVMTLVFGISSTIARDFSLMIQSIGMTAAAFGIVYGQIQIEWLSFVCATIGGFFGIIIGLQCIAPVIPGDYTKMVFVSVFLAFAITLFRLNRQRKRVTLLEIQNPATKDRLLFVFQGFVGGILSSMAGSGIDICTFTLLVLRYRVSEKIATPTSVCLMAVNTVIGFFWRGVVQQEILPETYKYWVCAMPAVVIGAPVGALVSSFLHRQVLACSVYITDVCQFVAALVIVPQTTVLIFTTVVTTTLAAIGFHVMEHFGKVVVAFKPVAAFKALPATHCKPAAGLDCV